MVQEGPILHKVLVHEEGREERDNQRDGSMRRTLPNLASFESGGMQGLKKLKSQGNEFFPSASRKK